MLVLEKNQFQSCYNSTPYCVGMWPNLSLACFSDSLHIEQLACVVLDSTQHHHSNSVSLFLDCGQDVLCPQGVLALAQTSKHNHRVSSFNATLYIIKESSPWGVFFFFFLRGREVIMKSTENTMQTF